MRSRLELLIAVVITTACIVSITPDVTQFLRSPDAGSQLTKGFAILHGLHPFVDVDSSVYGPAIFYVSALAQWLAPDRPVSELIVVLGGNVLAYGLLYWTLMQTSPGRILFWAFVVICMLSLPAFHKYHVILPPAIFLMCLVVAERQPSPLRQGFVLGIGCAIAGLFRLDFGAYCVITSMAYLLLIRGSEKAELRTSLAALLASGALVSAPWLVYVIANVGVLESVTRFADTTLGVYGGLAKPLPPFDSADLWSDANRLIAAYWSMKVLPLLILAMIAARLMRANRRQLSALFRRHSFLIAGATAAALFYLQAGHRIDLNHIQQVFSPVALITVAAVSNASTPGQYTLSSVLMVLLLCGTAAVGVDARLLKGADLSVNRVSEVVDGWLDSKPSIIRRAAEAQPRRNGAAYAMHRTWEVTKPNDSVLFLPYSAQSYYFSNRLFDTPFGWLNPGRFQKPGSEQRFIEAMRDTVLIVDNPEFTFDGMPSRNMRSYAPLLSEHLYTHYGIFEASKPYVFLSNQPEILDSQGKFVLKLTPVALVEDKSAATTVPVPRSDSAQYVARVNTLPSHLASGFRPVTIPHMGGLLLERGAREDGQATCAAFQEHNGERTFVVADLEGKTVDWSDIGAYDLIDVRAVGAGRFSLVRVPMDACFGATREVASMMPTGVIIDIADGTQAGTDTDSNPQ